MSSTRVRRLACLSRRPLSTSSTSRALSSTDPAAITTSPGFARLAHRRLLVLHGADATQFLQGLVTANVRPHLTSGFYAAFLNAQGRLLNDVFIYPAAHSPAYTSQLPAGKDASAPAYFIDVDAHEAPALLKHLKRHKLRAKIDVSAVDDGQWSAWSAWDDAEPWTPHPSPTEAPPAPGSSTPTAEIGCVDARAPGMGRRLILPSSVVPSVARHCDEAPLSAYHLRRILRGVPEGPQELPPTAALPLESNVDFMGGVDFRKGCYVGQELTIRTHHTGVVRKRILPVQLYTPSSSASSSSSGLLPPQRLTYTPGSSLAERVSGCIGANIVPAGGRRGRPAGKWLGGVGDVGLALVRLEMMTDLVLTAGEATRWSVEDEFKISIAAEEDAEIPPEQTGPGEDEVRIKAFVPEWHRNKIKVKVANRQVG